MDIEIYTDRYEREHGHKPQGRRFWRFTLVSSSITAKDHFLDLPQCAGKPYPQPRWTQKQAQMNPKTNSPSDSE
jgi:hypothetical protein